MPGQNKISGLIKRFEENREAYLSGRYNETQLRREFIDPFFKELGWDVDNEGGLAEAYKDVIHEDAIKIGGLSKAPDYCFRVGGTRKFFVEAKKPSVNLKEDVNPAFQLRRYAWSAKLPLSVLTDFEEFAVYDSRIKPLKTDKPTTARILYFTYQDYLGRWEEIAGIFSREAVLKGSFDKYAQSVRTKKGTAEVDRAFLDEIESWREMLAKNIAMRNPSFSACELNFVVQRTIDRIIFLRICEDRGIETYGTLQALLNGQNVYARLFEIFERADDRYNSGIFHFRKEKGRPETPDELSPKVKIDDDVLKGIFKGLYYPESSYEFSVLPVEILGQVYEQFLGQVIHLTDGHRAKIEEKPEVKKAGGVYYTPAYIVDYIVKETVGKLLEGKTPKQVAKLKVLDPACGSGSFLIGAYQCLLAWHRDWYVNDGVTKWTKGKNPVLYQHSKDDWRLTTFEKKRILLNNIYGVDIDSQAVEVTKLSLLLKVLEGESGEVISRQYRLFHERVLPDLGNNIKCGNSLIGPDIYNSGQMELWNNEERLRVNAFDWGKEFPEIMSGGGFDAVIGNPPYIRMEAFKELKVYLQVKYQTHAERADIFFYFVESAEHLVRRDGRVGFILSNTFTRSEAGIALRKFISEQFVIETLVEFGDFLPFMGATVYPIIVILDHHKSKSRSESVNFILQDLEPASVHDGFKNTIKLSMNRFSKGAWTFEDEESRRLRDRLFQGFPSFREVHGPVNMGIKTGLNEAFIIDDSIRRKILTENKSAGEIIKPYLGGRNLDRYRAVGEGQFLIYTPHGVDMDLYPAVLDHLSQFRKELSNRATRQEWFELQQPQEAFQKWFDGTKIIYPDMSRYPKFSLDESGDYFSNTVYFIGSDSKFLLGLLNSKLLWFVIRGLSNALRGGLWRFRLFSGHIERLPMPKQKSLRSGEPVHDQMVSLVNQMLLLHKQLVAAKTDHEKTALQRQIDATDTEIDRLVYQLYSLTEEEIKIVENSTNKGNS